MEAAACMAMRRKGGNMARGAQDMGDCLLFMPAYVLGAGNMQRSKTAGYSAVQIAFFSV